ncbi:MAG: peroxisomal assembly protein [Alyxoria varia]|nr:MAG: peroxisomal assembly protein [Alyxoria varia]
MDGHLASHTRKRKRRRGLDRPPLAAQLVLDEHLKSDVGTLSEDLFVDLFPSFAHISSQDVFHVCIAPRMQASNAQIVESSFWTILAVQRRVGLSPDQKPSFSALHFSPDSTALQMFAQHLQKDMTHPPRTPVQSSINIYILDAVPGGLDTVAVAVDDQALSKLESANRKYPFGQISKTKDMRFHAQQSTRDQASEHDRWVNVVRKALKQHDVVHVGDALSLPVDSHPITHAQPPPALVQVCEPVAQGLVTSGTKIVIVSTKRRKESPTMAQGRAPLNELRAEATIDEDTSNEQFYSAAEENGFSPAPKKPKSSTETESEEDRSGLSNDDDSDLSEGESNSMGLSLPMLLSQTSGTMSSLTSATPRAFNAFNDGITSPGSVISGFSMSTVLGGGSKGKLFEAHGLLFPIQHDVLNPKPAEEEDPEVRAFVDTKLLAKLGCFSGDWVRLESAPEEGLNGLGSWGISAFDGGTEDPRESRPMKLYALPWQSARRPRYAINKGGSPKRRRSIHTMNRSTPKVYLSPIVLSNLGNPPNLRISKLSLPHPRRASRHQVHDHIKAQSHSPPIAKHVMLHKFSSPIAHDKALDSSIKWAIQDHFMQRNRAVKPGDLIGIPIEMNLGRALDQGNSTDEDPSLKEVFGLSKGTGAPQIRTSKDVAWFKVASVRKDDENEDSPWGDLGTVDPRVTEIPQGKDEHGKLPEAVNNTWQYYLGMKPLPPRSLNITENGSRELIRPFTFVSHTRRRLRELISAATSPQAIHLDLPPVAILLVSNQRQVGKSTAAFEACADVGIHCFPIDSHDILSEGGPSGGDVKTAGFLEARAERGLYSGAENTALVIKHIDVLSSDRMVASVKEMIGRSRIFVATTANIDKLSEGMRSAFTHELEISAPDEKEREGILRQLIQHLRYPLSADVDLSSIALKTAALVAGDLGDVVDRAVKARSERLGNLAASWNDSLPSESTQKATVRDVQLAGGDGACCITKTDFDTAVEAARKSFADAIGAPKIPNVSWDDVGGLVNVKDAVMETIQLPLERPELFAKGMKKRSGILFYGPPGTGKTLLAKAIATEFSLNFFSVKGPELLNMYIGESEANVRRVFQRARDARPCVVFFDELDSVAPKRGNQGDSGGVMDRIVSQLLAELDGMSSDEGSGSGDPSSTGSSTAAGGGVFVIGATNRPDLLDQALLRPGRFDKMLYLGVPDSHDKQLTILEALTRKFTLDPSLSLSHVASNLPYTYTGADLYALCSDAMLKSITRRANAVKEKVDAINAQRSRRGEQPRTAEHSSRDQHNSDTSKPTPDSHEDLSYNVPADAQGSPKQLTIPQFFDHLATPEDVEVIVNAQDFREAQGDLVPSVSAKELEHYTRVRAAFEGDGEGKGGSAPVDDDDDDFIVRTGDMSIGNGSTSINGIAGEDTASAKNKTQGKGKGKAVALQGRSSSGNAFGTAAHDSEGDELYGSV